MSEFYEFNLKDVFPNCDINNPMHVHHYINKLTVALYGYSIIDIEFKDGNINNLTKENVIFKKNAK